MMVVAGSAVVPFAFAGVEILRDKALEGGSARFIFPVLNDDTIREMAAVVGAPIRYSLAAALLVLPSFIALTCFFTMGSALELADML